jgi:predicted nucleic acid-binding protein
MELLVAPRYDDEALFVYNDEDPSGRIRVDDDLMTRSGMKLIRTELTDDELSTSIRLSARLDDGEAQALAIALHRNVTFLSDDAAGLRVADQIGVTSLTTLDLAKQWSAGKTASELQRACQRLRRRARYDVPRNHSLAQLYRDALVAEIQPVPCHACDASDTDIVEAHDDGGVVRRVRECQTCSTRFETRERSAPKPSG